MSFLLNRFERIMGTFYGQLAVSVILVAFFMAPVLSGYWVVGDDATGLIIPQLTFYKNSFFAGASPFWNPNIAVGFSNFVDIAHPYAPISLLAILISPTAAHYWFLFGMLVGTVFLGIRLFLGFGVRPLAAFLGSIAYLLSSIWFTQSVFVATAVFSQALIFYSILCWARADTSKKKMILLAIACASTIANTWLCIGYWINLYLFFAGLIFVIFISKSERAPIGRLLKYYFVVWTAGSLVGIFQIIPAYVISQYSQRSSGLSGASAAGYVVGWRELFDLFRFTARRGLDAYLYMGIVPLSFFFYSFFIKNPVIRFFRWMFLVSASIAVVYSPVFWLIQKIPGFSYFQGASRFLFITNLATGALVALGAENFFRVVQLVASSSSAILRMSRILLSILTVILIGALLLWSAGALLSSVISIFILVMAYLVIKKTNPAKMGVILVLLAFIDFLFAFGYFYWPALIRSTDYFARPVATKFLKTDPGRIFPLFVDDWDDQYFYNKSGGAAPPEGQKKYSLALDRETFRPNYQLLHSIQSLEANEPLLNVDMGRLMALLGTRQLVATGGEEKLNKLYFTKDGKDFSVLHKFETLSSRSGLIDFLGIKYLLSAYSIDLGSWKPFGYSPIAYEELDIMGGSQGGMPLVVYDNARARPIAYLTGINGFVADGAEAYRNFKSSNFNGVYVECSVCSGKSLNGDGEIFLDKSQNGDMKLEVIAKGEQFLVFTQNHLPGWHAYLDGKEAKIYKVNSVFPGMFIPNGEHKVEFRYNYWSLFNPRVILGKHINGEAY